MMGKCSILNDWVLRLRNRILQDFFLKKKILKILKILFFRSWANPVEKRKKSYFSSETRNSYIRKIGEKKSYLSIVSQVELVLAEKKSYFRFVAQRSKEFYIILEQFHRKAGGSSTQILIEWISSVNQLYRIDREGKRFMEVVSL